MIVHIFRLSAGYRPMTLDANATYRMADKTTFRSVGDSGVILKTDTGQIYSCNSTAEAFLRLTDGKRSLQATADAICAEFDVKQLQLLADMEELLVYLMSENVLEPVDD